MYHLETLTIPQLIAETSRIKSSLDEIIAELEKRQCKVSVALSSPNLGMKPQSLFGLAIQLPSQVTI
jgi:hypothetical protein